MFKLTVKGIESLKKKFGGFRSLVKRVVRILSEEIQARVVANVNNRILRIRTGRLLQSWSKPPRIVESGNRITATPGSTLRYSRIHETGGIIRPVPPNKYLRFFGDSGWVQVKRVVIPARRYISKAIAEVKAQKSRFLRMAFDEAIRASKGSGI